jgi:hypothetical protein
MNRTGGRGLGVAAGVIACLCISGSPAAAEVGAPGATVQALAADAQFLEYAPPPPAPGVVCLIDSGVDPNPDTTPILAGSYALQPGTDTTDELSKLNPRIQPGNHPDGHGTYMAMIMAAPVNGWGMAGIAPTSVRVYSVKAMAVGQTGFSFGWYEYAINHCIDGPIGVSGISVINLSLGSAAQPSASDLAGFEDTVAAARQHEFDVLAAAGNDGVSVEYPAAAPGVLGIGATDANPADLGVFCSFTDRGSALSVLAPGCGSQTERNGGGNGIDVAFSDDGLPAWAFGTSEASSVASAVLASMRAYGPNLNVRQSEGCLTSTEVSGGNIDAAAAFRACGLGETVDRGMAAFAAATATESASVSPPSQAPTVKPMSSPKPGRPTRLTACPRLTRLRSVHGVIDIAVFAIPRGARLRVDAEREKPYHHFTVVASTTVAGDRARLRVNGWNRVELFFVDAHERSPVLLLSRPARASGGAPISNCRSSG